MREGEIGEGNDSEKMNQCLKITKYEICEWMETIICLIAFVCFDFFFFFSGLRVFNLWLKTSFRSTDYQLISHDFLRRGCSG